MRESDVPTVRKDSSCVQWSNSAPVKGKLKMLRSLFVSLMLLAMAFPAAAQDPKQEAENMVKAYEASFNKKDAAGIAALYTKDGIRVTNGGVLTDIAKFYEGVFQRGIDHVDIKAQSLMPVGEDVILVQGETHATGKNNKGEPLEADFIWSLVNVREGNQMKVRMLTIMPKAPPPKVADAK
jgi:uncharacterized protein (TIGR02246 family)